jgi:hypothetical protein
MNKKGGIEKTIIIVVLVIILVLFIFAAINGQFKNILGLGR